MVKAAIVRLPDRLGWDIRSKGWDGWGPDKLRPLARPSTVIDVGVCEGTPELYDAFPSASLLLVDPLPEAKVHMKRILSSRAGWYAAVALGQAEGLGTLNVTENRSTSSLNIRPDGSRLTVDHRIEVPVRTLDAVVDEIDPPSPFLLKIDVEGHELDVLRGARKSLERTDCLIAEVSVQQRFVNGYRFSEFVGEMGAAGFELADILTIKRDRQHRRVIRMDAAFRRREYR